MTAALLSPNWYRVAGLKPRLRTGVRIARHRVRGESWVVLTDPVSGRHHRFDRHAWALIAGCDGRRTLDEVWAARAEADVAPTQEQALRVVGQAFDANLLLGDVPPEAKAVLRARMRERRRQRRSAINPLAFRVRLANPDAWLGRGHDALRGLFAAVYGRAGLLALAGLLLVALALLAVHGNEFGHHAAALAASPRFWLLAWLAYPLLKALHELAHAFAVKHFGGEVTAIGVTLLLMTPVPYVDASAAIALPDKRKRAVVAAAGVATELALAALALALWVLLEPGWARDAAAAVVMVGGLSTLLVNGNPLLRFDGYHVATDLLELPNLASRSTMWWRFALRRLFGARHAVMAHVAPGERAWLAAFAPLSLAMQALVLGAAIVVLAKWNGHAAAAVALVAGWLLLVGPLARALWWVLQAPELHGSRARALALTLAAATLGLGLVAALPLPTRTHAPGLVWLPDDAFVRSAGEGFVLGYPVADGAVVERGTVVAELANDRLQARAAVVAAELRREQVEQALRFGSDALASAQAADRVARLEAEQAELAARIAGLQLRAARRGRLVLDPQKNRVGMFVPQGELIAQVLPLAGDAGAVGGAEAAAAASEAARGVAVGPADPQAMVAGPAPHVRAYVANEDIARVDVPGTAAFVTLAQGGRWPARLLPQHGAASRELSSPALGEASGGTIALDANDPKGRTAAEPRLALELLLPPEAPAAIGARVLVTFEHGPSSAVELAAAALRKLFLRQLDR